MKLAEAVTAGCSPALPTVARQVAVVTGASRIYVGAHLPLDVVGGLTLGSLADRLARAWLQRP